MIVSIAAIDLVSERVTLECGAYFRVRRLFGGWADVTDEWGNVRRYGSRDAAINAIRRNGARAAIIGILAA